MAFRLSKGLFSTRTSPEPWIWLLDHSNVKISPMRPAKEIVCVNHELHSFKLTLGHLKMVVSLNYG